ncbi:hypothetical protein GCM10020001_001010 [Nonomuraea salmonea]
MTGAGRNVLHYRRFFHGVSPNAIRNACGAGPAPFRAGPARRSQPSTLVQVTPFILNWAGGLFEPVAVAEKPKLWLEPGPM